MEEKLIAPCGLNCGVCISNLAEKHKLNQRGFRRSYCSGCLPRGKNCLHMGDQCQKLAEGHVRFCYECEDFPCKRLKTLDKRYQTKYHLSPIENLRDIEEQGIEKFLQKEEQKWGCLDCGDVICCHNGLCLNCKVDVLLQNRKYRWGEK